MTTETPAPIEAGADYIDFRDVIARIQHLRQLRQPGAVDLGSDDNAQPQDDLFAELAELEALASDLASRGGDEEWEGVWYPVSLIRESEFENYARELAEDIGAIKPDMEWPCGFIDWEAAANALRIDYSSVDFDGVEYLYR